MRLGTAILAIALMSTAPLNAQAATNNVVNTETVENSIVNLREVNIDTENTTTDFDDSNRETDSLISLSEVELVPDYVKSAPSITVSPDNTYVKVDLTEDEVYMLAQLIYREAGNCSYECQSACGSVAINLMLANNMNLYQVAHNPNMFSVAHLIDSTTPLDINLQVARDIAEKGTTVPPSVKCFRTDYYFDWATPYMNIDNVYFGSF